MKKNCNRRKFIKSAAVGGLGITLAGSLSSMHSCKGNRLTEKGSSGIAPATLKGESIQGKKYDWISHARIFIVDGYTYPLAPDIEFDAKRLAETMVDMHANVLRIASSGNDWFIPGTEFKVVDNLGNRDILAECIAACKPRGIKVVPYLRTGGEISASSMKPEWARVENPRGDIRSFWDLGAKVSTFCWNTTYRQAFYDYVKTVVSKYDIDGIYFDAWGGYGFGTNICYCEGCKKGFKKLTGEDIPYREDANEYTSEELKTLDRYRAWCKEELFEAFRETKRIVKSYKDIPLINNINNPGSFANRSPKDMRVINETDAFLYERGKSIIERAEGVSVATAHGFTVWPYVGTYDPFPRIPHYKYELGQEIFTTVVFGGSPILYHSYFFVNHPESREPVKEAFQTIDENYESFNGFRSDEFCAVVWNNLDPAGHPIKGYLWDVDARVNSLGSFSACIKNHIQTTSLLKMDLDNSEILNRYKVLYLPDICYLTDKQITNIKSFVEKGGGLVMTYDTSLYDENGNKLSDFALGDLAKIRYYKPDEEISKKMHRHSAFGSVWDMYLKTRTGQKVIKSPLSDGLIPTHVYETVDALPGGTVIADQVFGSRNELNAPGLVVSKYGKGKVAYISSAMGAMYLQTGIKEFSDFIRDVIDYVSPEGVPYEIEAPHSTLITNMTVNGNKRVFHLINWTGSQSERMWQNVYYIPPIENVTIKFKIPAGKRINKITSFVPIDFSKKKEKNTQYITLPRVEKYQGIVIAME
jgi:hypothetical protein